jgi:hypothetical protein
MTPLFFRYHLALRVFFLSTGTNTERSLALNVSATFPAQKQIGMIEAKTNILTFLGQHHVCRVSFENSLHYIHNIPLLK